MFIDPLNLEIGNIYQVSRDTPLMSSPNPVDPLKALMNARKLLPGSQIKLLKKESHNSKEWYEVGFTTTKDQESWDTGWVNPVALMGQDLQEIVCN